jgi:DNA-binding MarR family transcriptional regulator
MEASSDTDVQARIAHLAATCACNQLRRASRAVTNYYDSLLKEHTRIDIRITQVTMLVVVYLAGPQTINDMADHLALDRTTLTRNLQPLAKKKLIAIAPGADQRTRVVTLTAEGEQMLLKILPLWERAQAHMVDGIGQEHFSAWLAQLSEVAALAQGA